MTDAITDVMTDAGRSLEQSELLDCQMSTAVARLSPLKLSRADESRSERGAGHVRAERSHDIVQSGITSHITHHTSCA